MPASHQALGVALSGVNTKDLVLTVGAVASIAQTGLPGGQQAGVLAVVIVLGSVTVAASLVIYLAMGAKAAAFWTARGRGWPTTTRQSCWRSSSSSASCSSGPGTPAPLIAPPGVITRAVRPDHEDGHTSITCTPMQRPTHRG